MKPYDRNGSEDQFREERENLEHQEQNDETGGSALMLAIFALTLLTALGVSLLYVTRTNEIDGLTNQRVKRSFYGAEGALEHGREQLRQWNIASANVELDGELEQAAGSNLVIDFNPDLAEPIFDAGGNLTGFTNVGDDVPLESMSVAGGYTYSAYLTNDPIDGRTTTVDTNKKVTVTGLAVGERQSFEKTQAIVEHLDALPQPGATILLLGPTPVFEGGKSNVKLLTGNNCNQPVPPAYAVPVVGVIGPAAEAEAELGVDKDDTYVEGAETGVDTVDDLTATLDPRWSDCWYLRDLAARTRAVADVDGDVNTTNAEIGTPGDPKVVFINDDFDLHGNFHGAGVIWVTKTFEFKGTVAWDGLVFAVGTGEFLRYGAGNDAIIGGAIVANISGPDRILWTADDCSGPDGIVGNSDDGIASGQWDVAGSGTGDTIFCDTLFDLFRVRMPFDLTDFRQY